MISHQTTRIQQSLYILLAIGALFWVLLLLFGPKRSIPDASLLLATVTVGDISIPVTIANTDALRAQGLSGTPSLAAHTGKLFVFEKSGSYGFWMKDMRYPIDIVWIAEDGTVVGISSNIAPETYPKAFFPPSPIQYVLEINANEAKDDAIAVGVKITLPKNL